MCDISQQEAPKVFKFKDLENVYIELLKCYRIEVQSHVPGFAELLLERNTNLEEPTVWKDFVVEYRRTANDF